MEEEKKTFRTEFRKLIATILMNWAFQIMPTCDFKNKYADFMTKNIMDL